MSLPTEFQDLLSPAYRDWCEPGAKVPAWASEQFRPASEQTPILILKDGLDKKLCTKIAKQFSDTVQDLLPQIDHSIILGNQRRYAHLGQRTRSLYSKDLVRDFDPGVITKANLDMLKNMLKEMNIDKLASSESLFNFCTNVSGYGLHKSKETATYQLSEYRHGDYLGYHNDHYSWKDGNKKRPLHYLDIHFTFLTNHPMLQHILYQEGDRMTGVVESTHHGEIAIYRLPFWHQVTPLQVLDPKDVAQARRWLIMTALYLTDEECRRVDVEGKDNFIVKQAMECCATDPMKK